MRFLLLFMIGAVIGVGLFVKNAAPIPAPLPQATLSLGATQAVDAAPVIGPRVIRDLPLPPMHAKSAAIVDEETGVLLGEKNKDAVVPIASLSKLMTALVFLDTKTPWEKEVTMERSDDRPGGVLFIRPGERLTVYDLFMTALVGSTNNATIALARATGFSREEFQDAMNTRAAVMGLAATHFVEPTGLSSENVSSALDLVRLAWYAFQDPSLREAVTKKEYLFITRNTKIRHRIKTTNELLRDGTNGYTLVGAKTGFTNEAGYTFLMEAESNGHRVIVAVLGAPEEADRFTDADALTHWAFERYAW